MNKTQFYKSLILGKKMNPKTWMKQGGSIIHAFYNLVVVFLFFQKRINELIFSPYTCESVRNPKILLKYFFIVYLLNIKVIVCLK
jgi:hypothetical protein